MYRRVTPGLPVVTAKSIENVIATMKSFPTWAFRRPICWICHFCNNSKKKEKPRGRTDRAGKAIF
jgi:hypothetical protein